MSDPFAAIGLDVAKETFDACLLRALGKPLYKTFQNDPAGFAKLLRWVRSQVPADTPLHLCLEATGSYSQALALYLVEEQQTVSVENPARLHAFCESLGQRNKTDHTDAQAIARYCQERRQAPWRLCEPEVQTLVALLRRLANLKEQQQAEQNRLREPGLIAPVRESLAASLSFLAAEIARLKAQIDRHVKAHPRLREDKELLESIPGIGEMTALWILAELPDVKQFEKAQSAAAFAGLSPCEYRSGTSVKKRTRLSKAGSRYLRKALYWPSITAARYNPRVRALYERLLAKGQPKMLAIGAAMRKLLMIAYGVLKSRQPFFVPEQPNPPTP